MFSFSELELPIGYYIGLAALFGLAVGSFLNVVIHRLPRGESITLPASHCPQCQARLRPYDNIPLLSYALLRGRCRQCQASISWRYPVVELLTALLFAALVWRTGPTWWALAQMTFGAVMLALIFIDAQHQLLPDVLTYPTFVGVFLANAVHSGWRVADLPQTSEVALAPWINGNFALGEAALYGGLIFALATPAFLLLDWLDVLLFDRYFEEPPLNEMAEATQLSEEPDISAEEIAQIEGREQMRQRVVSATLLLGVLLAAIWVGLLYRYASAHPLIYERAYHALLNASFGASVAAGAIWSLRALYFVLRRAEGMGLGDVKMMAVIGGFLGWYPAFGVLLYGSVLGAVAGLILARYSKDGFNTAMPFGVCLGAVAILVMLGL